MTKIILTRHGHVEGIEPERFRGRTDVPLTELGRAQARAVAARISELWKPLMVYTSPMGRCVATGQEIAKACGAPSKILEDLTTSTTASGIGAPATRCARRRRSSSPPGTKRRSSCAFPVEIPCKTSSLAHPMRCDSYWPNIRQRPSRWSAMSASIARFCWSFSTAPYRPIGRSSRSLAASTKSISCIGK